MQVSANASICPDKKINDDLKGSCEAVKMLFMGCKKNCKHTQPKVVITIGFKLTPIEPGILSIWFQLKKYPKIKKLLNINKEIINNKA